MKITNKEIKAVYADHPHRNMLNKMERNIGELTIKELCYLIGFLYSFTRTKITMESNDIEKFDSMINEIIAFNKGYKG